MSLQVRIIDIDNTSQDYTQYVIQVKINSRAPDSKGTLHLIRRRYNDFLNLDTQLNDHYDNYTKQLKKNWWEDGKNVNVITQRKLLLNVFLEDLIIKYSIQDGTTPTSRLPLELQEFLNLKPMNNQPIDIISDNSRGNLGVAPVSTKKLEHDNTQNGSVRNSNKNNGSSLERDFNKSWEAKFKEIQIDLISAKNNMDLLKIRSKLMSLEQSSKSKGYQDNNSHHNMLLSGLHNDLNMAIKSIDGSNKLLSNSNSNYYTSSSNLNLNLNSSAISTKSNLTKPYEFGVHQVFDDQRTNIPGFTNTSNTVRDANSLVTNRDNSNGMSRNKTPSPKQGRVLGNRSVMLQERKDQDEELQRLASTIVRQKEISMAMNKELEQQNDLFGTILQRHRHHSEQAEPSKEQNLQIPW
ncbi:hypothetical protein TBLA_0I03290 [Henningerozyma blattae CBS 6284]|uniref:PX domain-containing protein n=1 Tax=Henningerozyma blattae (strain ATCC 34711 / CBS 6284 / DSM 70876 / NBRC 10599 / NRRL Y-10934 / UCD 77-7) TaxID=1071380 RepID=I2H9D2_HENB6|nr:hypothetical protein TBLA_0I03290 [Tetrapisispora blattae CBS 6284]CCH62984.1 hypothetical protein TBLA_0I03290 [Tetrapisispora blattae CBS 6284]